MAYEKNLVPNIKKQAGQDEEAIQPQSEVGPAPTGGGVGPSGARPATPFNRPNIQQYIKANIGAGNQLSQGIQANVGKQAGQFQQGVSGTQANLQKGSEPIASSLGQTGQNLIQTSFKNPQDILQQKEQLSQFQKLRDQGYAGDIGALKTNIGNQQAGLQTQLSNLGQTTGLGGTESGRFQLLQNTLNQPNYTRGQQKLDQLFLQSQPNVAKGLQSGLQNINQQATGAYSNLDKATQAKLAELSGLSNQRASDVQSLFNKGTDTAGLEGDINQRGLEDIGTSSQQRLAKANADIDYANQLKGRLANTNLTEQDLKNTGLGTGAPLYDVDLSKYLNISGAPTLANTADPTEAARYRALNQLAGGKQADMFGGEQQLGGFNPYKYDVGGMNTALASSKNFYENQKPIDLITQMMPGTATTKGSFESAATDQLRQDLGSIARGEHPNPNKTLAINDALNGYVTRLSRDDKENRPREWWMQQVAKTNPGIASYLNYLPQYNQMTHRVVDTSTQQAL